jgi:hypothetical protein
MKRTFAYLFLLLYVYNLAGYLVVFSVRQNLVRSEIKRTIKESVPLSEFIQFVFHTESLGNGMQNLQWIDDHEFRYAGGMYDIVRSHTAGDSTFFLCVNDVQEEVLFADLDSHVQREMGNKSGMLDAFRDVFKNSHTVSHGSGPALTVIAASGLPAPDLYESCTPEISSPPPRPHTQV